MKQSTQGAIQILDAAQIYQRVRVKDVLLGGLEHRRREQQEGGGRTEYWRSCFVVGLQKEQASRGRQKQGNPTTTNDLPAGMSAKEGQIIA